MHDYEVVEATSNIGMVVFGILTAISLMLCVVYLIGMGMYSGDISHDEKYTELKYQEYLIKNPGCELYVGDRQITQYKNEKFDFPIVVKLKTHGGHEYEAFVDTSGKTELIGNKLLISTNSS